MGTLPTAVLNGGDLTPLVPSIDPYLFGNLSRSHFPPGFKFGVGTSAFQVEGAMSDDFGRGKSMWDVFCQKKAKETGDDSWLNFEQGNHFYFKYQTDVKIMSGLSLDAFRFSISWPRIFPKGRPGCGNKDVNEAGVSFYNNLINALIAKGIVPYVTLFHWEVPQVLEEEYGGFLSGEIRNDFKVFANYCFHEFGDRVKNWFTLNEPYQFTMSGYGVGSCAPGHGYYPDLETVAQGFQILPANRSAPSSSSAQRKNEPSKLSNKGDGPGIEPYQVGRNLLLSHADVVHLYRSNFQDTQKGKIGITLNCNWFQPLHANDEDGKYATQRAFAFMLGWFLDPISNGQYPSLMTSTVPEERLKRFLPDESEWLKNTYDFIGVNYYTAQTVTNAPQILDHKPPHMLADQGVLYQPLGILGTSQWIYVYANGIGKLVSYVAKTYGDIEMYITENGVDKQGDLPHVSRYAYMCDKFRAKYIHDHLYSIQDVIRRKGVKVKGYFIWSFMDGFEWRNGDHRFGISYVDYERDYERLPKWSAYWYAMLTQSPRQPIWPYRPVELTDGTEPKKR